MDKAIMNKLSYGLYVLTAKIGSKRNGCIINTAVQVTSSPNRISIAVNKQNYTCEMIQTGGIFNLNILSEKAPFSLFKHFGFASGRDTDKFADFAYENADNTLPYITEYSCGYISAVVEQEIDLGSHMLFIASVTDGKVLSKDAPITYAYYHAHTKPKPQPKPEENKIGWRCKICGYVYEGENLPADYICPLCKHGAEDFEKIGDGPKGEIWVCKICGYVHEGPLPADFVCPLCKHGVADFEKVGGDASAKQPEKPQQPAKPAEAASDGKWRCKICGYVHEGPMTDDYVCPVCGVGADQFEPVAEEKPQQQTGPAKWQCGTCGYIYEGEEMPEDYVCPLCGVGADGFTKID